MDARDFLDRRIYTGSLVVASAGSCRLGRRRAELISGAVLSIDGDYATIRTASGRKIERTLKSVVVVET